MDQDFVSQKEFEDFVVSVSENVVTKEALAATERKLSESISTLEKKMLRSFDAVWERFHEADQRFDRLESAINEILRRLPK